MQERYHEYILRKLKEERLNDELDRNRQDNMEHDINLEWIRHFEKGSSQSRS